MDHNPENWGRPRDDVYGPYDASLMAPRTHTQQPVVTGTSVVAMKFKDGVVMAADNLASYGSLARFRDVERLVPYGKATVVGFSGDISDMQHIMRWLQSVELEEHYDNWETGASATVAPELADSLAADNIHRGLSKLLYQRRSKFDPLWNQIIVAGFEARPLSVACAAAAAVVQSAKDGKAIGGDESGSKKKSTSSSSKVTSSGSQQQQQQHETYKPKPFLAYTDLLGTTYAGAPCIATGFGSMLAVPMMRKVAPDEEAASKLSREDALKCVRECMKVLFYRDARSLQEYSLAVIERGKGIELTHERCENMSWEFAKDIRGYGTQTV